MIVVLIGADGVGKTTVAQILTGKLQPEFNVTFKKAFEDYFLLKYLLNLFKAKRQSVSQNIFFKKAYSPPLVIKLFWPWVILMDQLLLYIYLTIFARNSLIIGDRYLYSYLVTWDYYKMSNKLVKWFYLRFPKPDLCVVLHADSKTSMDRKKGEIAHRKKEYNSEFFQFHVSKYSELAKLLNLPVVDTTNVPIDTVVEEVANLVKKRVPNVLSG